MGTLHSQPNRDYKQVDGDHVGAEILLIKRIAKQTDVTFDQALRVFELMEHRRRNNLFVSNGDAWDEQISGIGKALDGIAESIESLKSTEA